LTLLPLYATIDLSYPQNTKKERKRGRKKRICTYNKCKSPLGAAATFAASNKHFYVPQQQSLKAQSRQKRVKLQGNMLNTPLPWMLMLML